MNPKQLEELIKKVKDSDTLIIPKQEDLDKGIYLDDDLPSNTETGAVSGQTDGIYTPSTPQTGNTTLD